MCRQNADVEVLISSNTYELEDMLEVTCSQIGLKYSPTLTFENLHLSAIPEGIY